MDEILLAVKNKEIDEESALDILIEFIDKTKITKVKNIIKLLSKGLLSLDNASKMLNVMSSLNEIQDKKTNSLYTSFYNKESKNSSDNSRKKPKDAGGRQKKAARPLEKEEYDQIMDLCRKGFEYFQDGKKRKFRPNEQLAMTFLLQANLGLRISDVLKLTPSTLKNDKLEIIEKKTGKLQYRDINKNLKCIIY